MEKIIRPNSVLSHRQLDQFHRDGYLVVRQFLARDVAAQWRDHFMALHAAGPVDSYFNPRPLHEAGGDMLKAYPRMLMPHRWDSQSREYLLNNRLEAILWDLFDEEPLAAQSMFYFKPPGARGQALHQDDFYLNTYPGHCLAAWFSMDDADRENGGLHVVPGSHRSPIFCPHAADLSKSFTVEEVDVPAGLEPVPVELQSGDVMFFNGSMIHGSEPNRTRDRFRRSFICHYVPQSTQAMSSWFAPLLRFDGEEILLPENGRGGPCGSEELEALRSGVLSQGELAAVAREQQAFG